MYWLKEKKNRIERVKRMSMNRRRPTGREHAMGEKKQPQKRSLMGQKNQHPTEKRSDASGKNTAQKPGKEEAAAQQAAYRPEFRGNITEGEVKKVVDSMQGKSQKEKEAEFLNAAKQEMSKGTIDPEQLEEMIDRMGNMVDEAQKQKMRALVGMLKK